MHLDVEIPDDPAWRLGGSGIDLSRRALEAFALEEYKAERISRVEYTLEDFHREIDTLKRLGF